MRAAVTIYIRTNGTEPELISGLHRSVEDRGNTVFAIFNDDRRIEGKGRNRAWNRLLTNLDRIDQIVLADAGDLPGRSVNDLLAILATLTDHGVSLLVPSLGIDTRTGFAAILSLVAAYRRAKRSQAIRDGQAKSSKRNGRPPIPMSVRRRILADLATCGVRSVARKNGVSPAAVSDIRRTMAANIDLLAA